MPGPDRIERGAELLERILADAEFRDRFRVRPVDACREAGFPDVADEIAGEIALAGGPMQTLEMRESRSSLVGVLMAAALEGMGVLELGHFAGSRLSGDAAATAHRALTRSGMRALTPGGAPHVPRAPHGASFPPASATPSPPAPPAAPADAASAGPAGAPGAAAPAPAAEAAGAPSAAPPGASAAAAAAPPSGAPAAAPPAAGPAGAAAPPPGADPSAASGSPAGTAVPGAAGTAPGGGAWPDAAAPPADAGAPAQAGGWPQAPAGSGAPAQAAANVVVAPSAPSLQPLLDNPRIAFPSGVRAAVLGGGVDPRFAPVLQTLARDHRLGIGAAQGQALDIKTVDGSPVGPHNPAAREVVTELAALDPTLRPSRVGGPWPISAPGFVSGAAHQDHIRLEFAAPPSPAAAPAAAGSPSTMQFAASDQAPGGRPVHPGARAHAVAASAPPPGQAAASAADAPPAGGGFDPVAAARAYPGDGAPKPVIAQWMADQARRAGLPPELPVMAALVESGLTNVNHGDRDSLGFFQMRTSYWLGPYPDFPHRPELQLKWFIDHALAVKTARNKAGQTAFEHDAGQYGNWIADVEQPAAAYRGRYQLRLAEARSLLGQQAGPPTDQPPLQATAGSAPAPTAPDPQAPGTAAPPATGTTPPAPAVPGATAPPPAVGVSPRATLAFTAAPAQAAAQPAAAPLAGIGAPASVTPLPGSHITVPGSPPHDLREVFERAATLDHRRLPYLWGGGHQAGVADVATVEPVDCSGAVSAVLGIDARVSGAYETWGEPGAGRYVTIYANAEHVLMEINGHFFGTSTANPGGGAGWIPRAHVPPSYLARFTVRHPPGL
jgi:hypothetical protein